MDRGQQMLAPIFFHGCSPLPSLLCSRMKHDRITIDPKVMGGKPVITGTRIPVDKILRELGNGLTYDDILHEYPRLTRADLLAAQRFLQSS
jgi:uncharacterized protein (DUF433 family)